MHRKRKGRKSGKSSLRESYIQNRIKERERENARRRNAYTRITSPVLKGKNDPKLSYVETTKFPRAA